MSEVTLASPREALARAFVQLYLEVCQGFRPPRHLYGFLGHAAPLPVPWPPPLAHGLLRAGAARSSSPRDDVFEAAVVVRASNGRASAVAVRFERRRGRWFVTALEDGGESSVEDHAWAA